MIATFCIMHGLRLKLYMVNILLNYTLTSTNKFKALPFEEHLDPQNSRHDIRSAIPGH